MPEEKTKTEDTGKDTIKQPSCPTCGACPLEIGFHEDVYYNGEVTRNEEGRLVLDGSKKDSDFEWAHYTCLACDTELPEDFTRELEQQAEWDLC